MNEYRSDNYLIHYASPYYDPVKAHEYYEAHKKLKGRRSTSGLNDEGKAAAKYVKDRLDEEYKQKVDIHKKQTDTNVKDTRERTSSEIKKETEATKSEIKAHSERMKSEISSLQEKLKRMTRLAKVKNKDRISSEIASLREENASQREKLQAKLSEKRTNLRENQKSEIANYREAHKTAKAQYKKERDDAYDSEMEKIHADSKFQAPKKSKGKKGGSSKNAKYGPGSRVNGIKL